MHRNDLRFYKLDQLLELALILGIAVDASQRLDPEKLKDAIVAGCNTPSPLLKAHLPRVDKFLGSFR